MITQEPVIRVGILDRQHRIIGEFHGGFVIDGHPYDGPFDARIEGQSVSLSAGKGDLVSRGREILCTGKENSSFTLHDVTIGAGFHWERRESQMFRGDLMFVARKDETVAALNLVPLEEYLASVASSEMNPNAPSEFLKAHSVVSRSWLVAMLSGGQKKVGIATQRSVRREGELIRWYDREDHDLYDVCADDHCQRYQGVTKILTHAVTTAVRSTRGLFLVHGDRICDARFSKSCGGLTECYENCWDETPVPYLQCVPDSARAYGPVMDEQEAEAWIRSSPDVYCNVTDAGFLREILPSFDQETKNFFRWEQEYRREELEELLHSRSGIDFGTLMDLTPVQRGSSGRIVRLKIRGTKTTLTVGKELEIRRWLSPSHLYSSAFVVETIGDASGTPRNFRLHGCGWGHGVGMCQIGAAVMASRGESAEVILTHYYRGTSLKEVYS